MKIGKAAQHAGLSVKTVRYYADIDLVRPAIDTATGYRDYTDDDIARLQFVGKARRFDFSVSECRELLNLYQDKERSSSEVKMLTVEKINEIDAKLAELQELKDQLNHLVQQCSGDERPDCPILDALSAQNIKR